MIKRARVSVPPDNHISYDDSIPSLPILALLCAGDAITRRQRS
jgi:hypothetical protein